MGDKTYFRDYDPAFNPQKARILGNTKRGDGIRFKGRGYIQLTGRDNYRRAGKAIGQPLEKNPELAARPDIAAQVAVWYWMNRVRPKVEDFADIRDVTRAVNPGLDALRDRHRDFLSYVDFYKLGRSI